MRAVVQRVSEARVSVDGEHVGSVGMGLCVLLGVSHADAEVDATWMAAKLSKLRVFSDNEGRMNLSVADVGGEILVVSQFTLYGDCRKGNRPSFVDAATPDHAEPLIEQVVENLRSTGVLVASGRFRTEMMVQLVNDGPVTLVLDSPSRLAPPTSP